MTGLDTTAVIIGLPSIGRSLHAGVSGLQWSVAAYTATLASLLMFSGAAAEASPASHGIGVIRVIEDQITTLRPYDARYTGDHRSIIWKRYTEMITRVSLDLVGSGTTLRHAAPSRTARSPSGNHPRPARTSHHGYRTVDAGNTRRG
jgi:hypothetical protein